MKIQHLTLFTNNLHGQRTFYEDILNLNVLESNNSMFTVKIGFSKLTFKHSEEDYKYHFCFLIPSNKMEESVSWLEDRLEIIKIDEETKTQFNDEWNAESVYFYDGNGNIAEFIARRDLESFEQDQFDSSQIICINEIGLPTNNLKSTNQRLEQIGSIFWKGDLERFGANGTQLGLFILVNTELKKTWFPTDVEIQNAPFDVKAYVNSKLVHFTYTEARLQVESEELKLEPQ